MVLGLALKSEIPSLIFTASRPADPGDFQVWMKRQVDLVQGRVAEPLAPRVAEALQLRANGPARVEVDHYRLGPVGSGLLPV